MKIKKRIIACILCIIMVLTMILQDIIARNTVYAREVENTTTEVLLIKNKNPWDSTANESVLKNLGIQFSTTTVENAQTMDLSDYRLIIVANDQADSFYRKLSAIRTKLELFVMNGGTLLYGVCDSGWGEGRSDLLIPGDVELGPVTYMNNNYIVDDMHPVVSGILTDEDPLKNNQLYGNYASHRYIKPSSLPADSTVILNAGETMPTLVEYAIGNGVVIASTLTWEHNYDHFSNNFGKNKFDDLILYAYLVAQIVNEANGNPNLGISDYLNGLTCTEGDPVNVANGNFITGGEDIAFEGDVSINFSRCYNSLDDYNGVMGNNWRGNYDISLLQLSKRRYRLVHQDGHTEDFIYGDDGVWYETPGTKSKIKQKDDFIIITLSDKTTYKFAGDLKLISIKEAYSKEIKLEYDKDGKLVHIHQGNFSLSFVYENNKLVKVYDNTDRVVEYSYTGENLTEVKGYKGQIYCYKYDENGNMISMTKDGYTVINEFDSSKRVVSQEMIDEGTCCKFIYDDENFTTTYIDKNGAETVYYRDEKNRIYKKVYNNGSETIEFDNSNNKLSETDKMGNTKYYMYDMSGNCLAETDELGNTYSYEYDDNNNKIACIDPEGNRFEYTYDKDNYLTSQKDAKGAITEYVYNDNKQLVKVILPNNKNILYKYDDNNNVTSITDADGNITKYEYDKLNHVVKEIDALGNATQFEYSDFGKNQKEIYSDGTYTVSKYDNNGNLISYTDELGNTEKYSYNAIGLLVSVMNAKGDVMKFKYDCMNNVSAIVNPDGSKCSYEYDINDNLTKLIDEEGNQTIFAYDVNGNVISETDPNGNVTKYKYDALNRIVKVIDAKGNSTVNKYSSNGKVISITDGCGNKKSYEYDENSQLVKMLNEVGDETNYKYNSMGQVISETDANGEVTRYEYNSFGDITKIINANKSVIEFLYNANGDMVAYVEPNGAKTSFEYNAKGEMIKEIHADGTQKMYQYDAKGHQSGLVDENGNRTLYEYDAVNNLTKVVDATGNETMYEYDSRNNLIKMIQNSSVQAEIVSLMKKKKGTTYSSDSKEVITSYTYDKKGQLLSECSPLNIVTKYKYDGNGNIVKKTIGDKNETVYQYDELNNVEKIKYNQDKVVSYKYNANGFVTEMKDWNGTTKYDLDSIGRVKNVTDFANRKVSYEWNKNNQKSKMIYADGTTVVFVNRIFSQKTIENSVTFSFDMAPAHFRCHMFILLFLQNLFHFLLTSLLIGKNHLPYQPKLLYMSICQQSHL